MGNGADDERAGELMSEAQVMRELIRENDRLRARVAELEANKVQLNGWIAHREQERDEAKERVAELEAAGQLRAKAPQ